MGREYIRKQAKKEGKNVREITKQKQNVKNDKKEVKKLLIILGVIVLIIVCLYIFIGLVITKEIHWFDKKEENTTTKVDNAILAKNTLRQQEEEYYVYFYDFNNENTSIESGFISRMYNQKIYRVNIKDAFNTNFITEEESNILVNNIDDLKIKDVTLVKVVSESIVEFYESEDKILTYING